MITLGLGNFVPKRREQRPIEVQTLSEIAELLEPSPMVFRALSETVAWCLSLPPRQDHYRSIALDPSDLLRVPPLEEAGMDVYLDKKRDSYVQAVDSINVRRTALLRGSSIGLSDAAIVGSRGRILLYEPLENVSDGASASSSLGFFDMEDAPPWDTWFLHSSGSIFSWVPEDLTRNAQAGINANPVDCIHWCDWSKL